MYEPFVHDPTRTLLLHHERGIRLSPGLAKVYTNQLEHDPSDIHRAREIAHEHDPIPVGILYHDPDVPCYEELRKAGQIRSVARLKSGLEAEFDKFTVWPQDSEQRRQDA